MAVIHLESIDSTNNYSKQNISNLVPYSLITANEQTSGRGRGNHSFYSPKNSGLYMSCVLKENKDLFLYTPAAAVAVIDVLKPLTNGELGIKWVNDIYLDNKKICGILCERIYYNYESYVIVGIGINISTTSFPDDISNAGSLNVDIDPVILGKCIYDKMLEINSEPDNESIFQKYRSNMNMLGKRIGFMFNNVPYSGVLTGLNKDCSINVSLDNGNTLTLNSGEITLMKQE